MPLSWNPLQGKINSNITPSHFITAETVAILAGVETDPAGNGGFGSAELLGLVQDWGLQQRKQGITEVFECGSDGRYIIPGTKVSGGFNFSRVLFDETSSLFMLYKQQVNNPGAEISKYDDGVAGYTNNDKTHGMFFNLKSGLFMNHTGIFIVMRSAVTNDNQENRNVAAMYLKNAVVSAHNIGARADAPYVGEQVSITFEDIIPIGLSSTIDQPYPSKPSSSSSSGSSGSSSG